MTKSHITSGISSQAESDSKRRAVDGWIVARFAGVAEGHFPTVKYLTDGIALRHVSQSVVQCLLDGPSERTAI